MSENKWKNIKNSGEELALDTFLTVSSESAAEVAKASVTSIAGDLLIDTTSSLVPGISGVVQNYKRNRFEKNIIAFTTELQTKVDHIRTNLEAKTEEQRVQIDQLFQIVLDYVIDEQQEEKVQFMVNGFVNITEHDHVSTDFVLTYYDVLKEMRMIDIAILRFMYDVRYVSFDQASKDTYRDILERHGINYDQYEAVRRNLVRIGVFTTRTDLNITNDLNEISKTFKELHSYLEKLTNPKFKGSLPKLKEPKLKSKDDFEVSKFGRDFVSFFLDIEQNTEN
ncbi:hypothetical protein [Planococcus plakortidis]|uniref:hypothetical protein n=1 Tax=Planococcus plakortidis TaxID=1038856 RepID=UPI00385CAAE4